MKVKIPHDWFGWPTADRHPNWAPINIPLHMSPDGLLGYIKVHKCASNTHTNWLINERGWGRAWSPGSRMHTLDNGPHRSPSPSSLLVLVRDPVDRWLSAVGTLGRFKYDPAVVATVQRYHDTHDDLFTKNMNQHFWPYTWFLDEWSRFADRMDLVDIVNGWDWFESHGVADVPKDRHTNKMEDKWKLREDLLTPDVESRIRRFHEHDYALCLRHGLDYR